MEELGLLRTTRTLRSADGGAGTPEDHQDSTNRISLSGKVYCCGWLPDKLQLLLFYVPLVPN